MSKTDVGLSNSLTDLAARWTNQDVRDVNCFAVWAEATLTKGVELTAAPAPRSRYACKIVNAAAATKRPLTHSTIGHGR